MSTRIQLRRDTAANWTSNNPTLAEGELGVELDTNKFKIGNGSSVWNDLDYAAADAASFALPSLDLNTLSLKTFDVQPSSYSVPSTIAYGNGVYVLGFKYSPIGLYYSTDGESWNSTVNPFDEYSCDVYDLVFADGLFVAVGEAGVIATSLNGIDWTLRSYYWDESNALTTNYYDLTSIAYGDGCFAAVGWDKDVILISSNGLTWSQTYFNNGGYFSGIVFGDGHFVASGWFWDEEYTSNGGIVYASSYDLTNWTKVNISLDPYGVNYGNGVFVVTGYRNYDPSVVPVIYASSNNLDLWTSSSDLSNTDYTETSGAPAYLARRGIVYGNGLWFIGLQNWSYSLDGYLIYSDDNGITWQQVQNLSMSYVTDISVIGDKVIVSGDTVNYALLNNLNEWFSLQDLVVSELPQINSIVNNRLFIGSLNDTTHNPEIYLTEILKTILGYDSTSSTGLTWLYVPESSGINQTLDPINYDSITKTLGLDYTAPLSLTNGSLTVSFGTTSTTAVVGNDSRLSNSRTPTGSASGDLTGNYPNPSIATGAVTDSKISSFAAIAASKISGTAVVQSDVTTTNTVNKIVKRDAGGTIAVTAISATGTISAAALGGSLLSSGTPALLAGTASAGTFAIPARADHAHRTVVVFSDSQPSNTDVVWVDTSLTASQNAGIFTANFANLFKWGND